MKNGWVEGGHGNKAHYVNDVIHNDDGPAWIGNDGQQEYYQHGLLHREDGPAIIRPNEYQVYYQHGKLHREDGPAYIGQDGYQEYWLFDIEVTREHLIMMGLTDYPENGFSKDQVLMFSLICME